MRSRLADHDGVLVIGAPVMRYHRWEPADYVDARTDVVQLTCDPGEAGRAPYGDAVIADLAQACAEVRQRIAARPSRGVVRRERAANPNEGWSVKELAEDTVTGLGLLRVLNEFAAPHIRYVNEATTLDQLAPNELILTKPGQYLFPASGGLGFGAAAAVGVALARPDDTVVAIIGDGSIHYAITALYTAAQRQTRTVFVIANNGSYGALRGFAAVLDARSAPGLDLPGISVTKIARGYGVPALDVVTLHEFSDAYEKALAATGPVLINVSIDEER